MNNLQNEKINNLNLFAYTVLSLTLLLGFYFGEDSSGSGGFRTDFNNTWPVMELIHSGEYFNFSKYTIHFPLHYYILFFINLFLDNKESVMLIF